ncbi:unnamed protein product [Timema podura]|uniref:IQ domain-containing protein K n=1 Tax=Timema podura TaxID=61482 RepID=A0ABN7NLL7_TIMPD|nr:unnamed protein product [Timema podura]
MEVPSKTMIDYLKWSNQEHERPNNAHSSRKTQSSLWEEICSENEEIRHAVLESIDSKKVTEPKVPDTDGPVDYLNKEIFPILLPALEAVLTKAKEWDCLEIQKSRFNGLDYLAEYLWNKNRRHPARQVDHWKDVFCIPFVKRWLKEHPRPLFPMSWLWNREEATLIIQSTVRGFLVRRRPEVQEMRQFWKAIREEKKRSSVDSERDVQEEKEIEVVELESK